MIDQNLIIYKYISLYHILEELSLDLNFKITFAENENSLNDKVKKYKNYLIISNKEYSNIVDQFILKNTPINIFKLVEKINIEFLKLQFNSQSQVRVNNYTINLNSREMLINDIKLKLTEKEINTISYLSQSNKPVSIDELQKKVWSYQYDIETHTVETHIYRLRKKIYNTFNDKEFIISQKNGYQIK
jgi:DNA-binding response OmpR family regulator